MVAFIRRPASEAPGILEGADGCVFIESTVGRQMRSVNWLLQVLLGPHFRRFRPRKGLIATGMTREHTWEYGR